MSTDDILDSIDKALRDVDVSADAMRWTPEAPEIDAKDPTGLDATRVLVGREERPETPTGDYARRAVEWGAGNPAGRSVTFEAGALNMDQIATIFNVPPSVMGHPLCTCTRRTRRQDWHSVLTCRRCNERQGEQRRGARIDRVWVDEAREFNANIALSDIDTAIQEGDIDALREALERYAHNAPPFNIPDIREPAEGRLVQHYVTRWFEAINPRNRGRGLPTLDEPRDGYTACLFLGGSPPYDGSVINVRNPRAGDVITAGVASAEPWSIGEDYRVTNTDIPVWTYTAHPFNWDGEPAGLAFLCGMTQERAQPILNAAIRMRIIGPDRTHN